MLIYVKPSAKHERLYSDAISKARVCFCKLSDCTRCIVQAVLRDVAIMHYMGLVRDVYGAVVGVCAAAFVIGDLY